jgi:hypothetical protein
MLNGGHHAARGSTSSVCDRGQIGSLKIQINDSEHGTVLDGVTGLAEPSKPLARCGGVGGALARCWGFPGGLSSFKLMV